MKKHPDTKKIIMLAILTAFDVIFTRLLAVNALYFKIGLGFAAIGLCGMLYGPVWAAIAAAAGDLIGSLLFPTGAYFPGFTATAAIAGAIYGLVFYRRRARFRSALTAALLTELCVTLCLNTLMISLVFGPELKPLLLTRLPEFFGMLAIKTAVFTAIGASDTLWSRISAQYK